MTDLSPRKALRRLRHSSTLEDAAALPYRAVGEVRRSFADHPLTYTALAAAGAGLLVGLLAPTARKLAAQGISAQAGDWAEVLTREHRMVEGLLDLILETGPQEKAKRKALLAKVDWGLSKHAYAEETVIYPVLREIHQGSEDRALFEDHAEIKILLARLRDTPADHESWLADVRQLRELVSVHAAEEEAQIFPALRDSLSEDRNRSLTKLLNVQEMRLA